MAASIIGILAVVVGIVVIIVVIAISVVAIVVIVVVIAIRYTVGRSVVFYLIYYSEKLVVVSREYCLAYLPRDGDIGISVEITRRRTIALSSMFGIQFDQRILYP